MGIENSLDFGKKRDKELPKTPAKEKQPKQKERAFDEKRFRRSTEYTKAEQLFSYGQLPENHPTQVYINSLADRIPKKKDFPLHVIFQPDWRAVNACALPDGTVFLGADILKGAESEEALLGIITHEYVHAYKRHSQKQVEQIYKMSKAGDILETISLARGHEYEADLRGVLVDLQDAGVSPIGYKIFLEKLSQKESDGGIVHGSSMDRALNIASAVHLVDFRELATDLHPIPKEVIEAVKPMDFQSKKPLTLRPATLLRDKSELPVRHEKRRDVMNKLRPDEIPFAISAVKSYTDENWDKKGKDPDDEAVLNDLCKKFENECLPKDMDKADRSKAGLLGLRIFCGVDVFGGKKSAEQIKRRVDRVFSTPQDFEAAKRILGNYPDLDLFVKRSALALAGDISGQATRQNLFTKDGKIDISAFKRFADDWAPTLVEFSKKNDPIKPRTVDTIKEEMSRSFCESIKDKEVRVVAVKELGVEVLFRDRIVVIPSGGPELMGFEARSEVAPIRLEEKVKALVPEFLEKLKD
ncbi:M48 family metalloprotease, partial [Candidatus Uhrbacteria bacterium]|nr:M48 family metalloprotease [Candidatus Uhrbacteria bacterium]